MCYFKYRGIHECQYQKVSEVIVLALNHWIMPTDMLTQNVYGKHKTTWMGSCT